MKTKYRLESIAFYDTEALAAHLGEMAALGWELESVGLLLWKYRKIQREKRTYGITFIFSRRLRSERQSHPSPK
ncbi:MAG: DUF2812 domain-containing protein [Anaerotignum sp.]